MSDQSTNLPDTPPAFAPPSAPAATGRRVPWLRIVLGVLVAGVALALPYYNDPATNQVFCQVMYLALAAMGLNLLTGYNGQISLGHGAFFGIGAFTAAILTVDHGWMIEATFPVAAVLAAIVGVVVGFPALRLKGLYLALITLGLAVLFPLLVKKFVEGPGGVPLLKPKRSQVGSTIDFWADDIYRYYVCLAILAVMFLLAWNLVRGRMGRAMIAVRDQEVAASTVGISVANVKVWSFALSAAYAGLAGAMSTYIDRTADASNPIIYFQRSIEFLIAVVIGGAATIGGPLLGAMLLVAIRRRTEGTEAMAPALLGGALIIVVYVLPDGIVGGMRRLAAWVRGRTSGTAPPPDAASDPTPSTPAPSPT
ncbi:branched-chain amino acid ABC transporter permease [Aquihabitans daechungensis]|uniref:branched-chain amino acid ABC transporter permease n=1 Tax=Aquihabitans daechungensis TaxID=1052257 RepID=UPI003B9F6AA8